MALNHNNDTVINISSFKPGNNQSQIQFNAAVVGECGNGTAIHKK